MIRHPVQSGIVSSSGRHMSAAVGAHELSQAEGDLSRVLGLKSYLKNVEALHQLLRAADVTDHLLASLAIKTGADKTGPTLGLLAAVLQEDAAYSRSAAEIGHARMWAIRALPNDAIDLARAEHRRTREEAEAYFALKLALFQGKFEMFWLVFFLVLSSSGLFASAALVISVTSWQHFC